jgi:hypothetical protein
VQQMFKLTYIHPSLVTCCPVGILIYIFDEVLVPELSI